MTTSPQSPRFDELIHPSTRLALVAMLAAVDWVEFAYLKETLNISDSALSKQLSVLERARYVTTERRLEARRRKVYARLTAEGRVAFDGHVAALRAIVDGPTGRKNHADDAKRSSPTARTPSCRDLPFTVTG
jgi:DNA-binding transcriptional ArsR family regulator